MNGHATIVRSLDPRSHGTFEPAWETIAGVTRLESQRLASTRRGGAMNVWMVLGVVIYFAYGYRRSHLRNTI